MAIQLRSQRNCLTYIYIYIIQYFATQFKSRSDYSDLLFDTVIRSTGDPGVSKYVLFVCLPFMRVKSPLCYCFLCCISYATLVRHNVKCPLRISYATYSQGALLCRNFRFSDRDDRIGLAAS